MQTELDDFLHHCQVERRLAPLSCSAYERDVRACLTFLRQRGIVDLALVRPPDLCAFLAEEAKRRPAAGSQARTVAALKCFFRFLVENEYLERDPAHVLRTPKKREALPDVLDRRELGRLLAVADRDDVWQRHFPGKRERDRLLLALFAYAGLRRSELLGLDWDDVDLERRVLHVRRAKGGRQRVVPIHPALEPLFADYLRFRARDPEPALFVGVHGRRLSITILSQTFRRYARTSGVTERKRVTPHTLRHVFASELLRAGANLRQIQELLGHKHLDSTQCYTRVTAHELAVRSSASTSEIVDIRAGPCAEREPPERWTMVSPGKIAPSFAMPKVAGSEAEGDTSIAAVGRSASIASGLVRAGRRIRRATPAWPAQLQAISAA